MSVDALFDSDLQPMAFTRKDAPIESYEAAQSVRNITETQAWILGSLSAQGAATDETLFARARAEGFRISPSGLRSRRSELVALQRVQACGEGTTAAGRKCAIWAVSRG